MMIPSRLTGPALAFLMFAASFAARAASLRDMIEGYTADRALLGRHWSVAGDSDAEMARERKLFTDWQKRVGEVKADALDVSERVDLVLLRNELESSLDSLAEREGERRELSAWLPFRQAIDALADARVRGEPLVPEKAAAALAPLAEKIAKLQEQLKAAKEPAKQAKKPGAPAATPNDAVKPGDASKPDVAGKTSPSSAPAPVPAPAKPAAAPKPVELPTAYQALRAAEVVGTLAGSLKQWFENYNGFMPEFGWWMKQPFDETSKALEGYGKYLREELAGIKGKDEGPLLGKSIGEERLRRQLGFEFIPYAPQALITLAGREFAWCEEQMKAAAGEMKLGEDWKAALARTKLRFVKPGEQEKIVREEGRLAIDFVKSRKLVTVPPDCEEWWGTRMLSAQEQKQMPYAAYSGHDVLVAYANETMKHDDKLMSMRGNSRPFTHNVVPHELVPGHHLQSYMAARHRPYRSLFGTPFFIEGWALYWEMRLWDLGYHRTPEEKVGALFWRMHRCARIIVTLKFHLGQMTPEEMVNFLTERVGHEKFGATSEVRRFIKGGYSPLYQCGYMLGGLQLRALHGEIVGAGKMSEQQFHDAILRLGPLPVELIRASLLNQPPAPEFKTQWRFDG